MMGYQGAARIIFLSYLFLMLGFDIFIGIDIFAKSGINCDHSENWQVTTLVSVDTV